MAQVDDPKMKEAEAFRLVLQEAVQEVADTGEQVEPGAVLIAHLERRFNKPLSQEERRSVQDFVAGKELPTTEAASSKASSLAENRASAFLFETTKQQANMEENVQSQQDDPADDNFIRAILPVFLEVAQGQKLGSVRTVTVPMRERIRESLQKANAFLNESEPKPL